MTLPRAAVVFLGSLVLLSACSDRSTRREEQPEPPHPLLADAEEVRHDDPSGEPLVTPVVSAMDALTDALDKETALQALVVAQPDEGAVFVDDGQPPRFLWRDPADTADTWWVGLRLERETSVKFQLLVRGGMPAEAALDPFSMSLHAWTPSSEIWTELVEYAAGAPVVVMLVGFAADAPDAPLSRGSVTITVSAAR